MTTEDKDQDQREAYRQRVATLSYFGMLSCQSKFQIPPGVSVVDGAPWTISFALNVLGICAARCADYKFMAMTQLLIPGGFFARGCSSTLVL